MRVPTMAGAWHGTYTTWCVRAIALLALIGCTNEPKILPPREPPARTPPPITVPQLGVAQGYGRVVLHGTDGPMRVTARADQAFVAPGMHVPSTRTGDLCVTPCVVDLPTGQYKLYLVSADGSVPGGDVDTLQVRDGLTYYVRAPGRSEPRTWLPGVPFALVLVGAVALTGGLALLTGEDEAAQTTGFALLAGGGAAVVVGGVMYYDASRGTQQEGATTTWSQAPR
jgi:hypothetical protein